MGVDFIRKAAPSFRKGLDRKRIELATPKLFTLQPTGMPRAYAAIIRKGQSLKPGEEVCICLDQSDRVLALRGMDPVAVLTNPPAELVSALIESHGEACGRVKEVHDIADIAEITVC